MTYHSIETPRDEGVVLIQLSRPVVRKALDERVPAFRGR
jgi:hypothetical protein